MNCKSLSFYVTRFSSNRVSTIASIAFRVVMRMRRRILKRQIIAIERYSGIGDIICTFPGVLALREKFPNAYIVYGVQKQFRAIVEMGKVADKIVESDWNPKVPMLFAQDYDKFFRPRLDDEEGRFGSPLHLVDDFARTLGVNLVSRQPRLYIPKPIADFSAKEANRIRDGRPLLFGIHTGPSWAVREWRAERWELLVRMIRSRYRCTVVQFGSDVDTTRGLVGTPRVNGAYDCVGRYDLAQTVGMLETLDAFIGIDSGLLHIAGAVGTPTIGLFGPISPALRLPPETLSIGITSNVACLGCHHRNPIMHWRDGCPNNIACMTEITPEAVFKGIESLMGQPSRVEP